VIKHSGGLTEKQIYNSSKLLPELLTQQSPNTKFNA